jgi:SAM-dependent methyltransferase
MGTDPLRFAPNGLLASAPPPGSLVGYTGFGLRWILRRRLKWARDALPGDGFATVLEVGYGNGAFMHELAKRATQIYGSDVHLHGADVRQRLARDGVVPHLVRSNGGALPFRPGAFDAVVIVSPLDQADDPACTLREAMRVVRTGGAVVCIAPRVLRWVNRLAALILGVDPDEHVQGARLRMQVALADRSLRAERTLRPRLAPRFLAPYEVVVLRQLPARPPLAVRPV